MKKYFLFIAIGMMVFSAIILWSIYYIIFCVIVIALILVAQIDWTKNKNKLNEIPMEIVEPFRQLHKKEQDDAIWFVTKLLFLSKKIDDELIIFNTINDLLEKAVENNEAATNNLKAEKQKVSIELNATNDKFEALRKRIL